MAALKTYYNARCPVCRPAVEKYAATPTARGADLQWHDINDDESALAHLGVTADDVRKRLHVLDGEGGLHVGVAAFEAIWSELDGSRWKARVIRAPGIRRLAGWAYEVLAALLWYRNRRWPPVETGTGPNQRNSIT